MWTLWTTLSLASTLQLEEVLGSLDARTPQLAAAESRVVSAEAELLAARGAFDPVLDLGLDSQGQLEGGLGMASAYGPGLSVGSSWDGSELVPWVQAELPLLEDLIWNEDRLKRDQARTRTGQAELKLEAERVKARAAAASAWWSWAAYGEVLELREEQLALAQTRAGALERQVEEGLRAGLDVVDNERVVLQRQASELEAERQVEQAALKLSLWWREDNGSRRVPDRARLPELGRAEAPRALEPLRERLAERPDLLALERELELLGMELKLQRSQRLPELDATLGWSPGAPSAGLSLSHALPNRAARGSLRALEASIEGLELELELARDRALAELEAAWVGVQRGSEREQVAQRRVELSRQVLEAEGRRFELGSADLFRLVLREDELAKARLEHLKARLDLGLALVRLEAAAGVR